MLWQCVLGGDRGLSWLVCQPACKCTACCTCSTTGCPAASSQGRPRWPAATQWPGAGWGTCNRGRGRGAGRASQVQGSFNNWPAKQETRCLYCACWHAGSGAGLTSSSAADPPTQPPSMAAQHSSGEDDTGNQGGVVQLQEAVDARGQHHLRHAVACRQLHLTGGCECEGWDGPQRGGMPALQCTRATVTESQTTHSCWCMADGWETNNSCTSLWPHLAGWPQTAPACRAQSARGCAVRRRPWCCPTRSAQSHHRAWGGAGRQVGLRKPRAGWTCHTPPSPRNSACSGGSGGPWPAHPTSWRGHRPRNLAHCDLTITMCDGDSGGSPGVRQGDGQRPSNTAPAPGARPPGRRATHYESLHRSSRNTPVKLHHTAGGAGLAGAKHRLQR